MKNFYDLDFDNIRDNFKEFLGNQDEFSDYNFEGSALSELLDVFAYALMYGAFYQNMNNSELFIDSAEIAENVYKIAHRLNYLPKRKGSPRLSVTFQKSEEAANLLIPKYTKFLLDDICLVNMEDISLTDDQEHTYDLMQGEIVTEEFTSEKVSGTDEYEEFTLENMEEVDNVYFYVYVDPYDDDEGETVANNIEWECVRTQPSNKYKKFYLKYFEEMKIRFDNGSLYEHPVTDDLIRVMYLKTDGAKYNGSTGELSIDSEENAALATLVDAGVTMTMNGVLTGGTSEDSLNDIKNLAPQFHVTQNRAVTEGDYNTLVKTWTEYESLYAASLWGGEKEALDSNRKIIEYNESQDQDLHVGYVYLTAVNSDFSYLSNEKIERLKSFFDDYKMHCIFLKFLYPNIVTIDPDIKIHKKDIFGINNNNIRNEIVDYLDDFKGKDKTFNKSNLLRAIDSISGVDYSDVNISLSVQVYHEDYKVIRLNNAVVAGSLSATVNGYALTDNGVGVVQFNNGGVITDIGSINYDSGFIIIDLETTPCEYFIPDEDYYDISFQFQNIYSMSFNRETFLNYNDDFEIDFDSI